MAKQAIALPTELWIRVLEAHSTDQNLPEIWNTVRHVSTSFKVAVETIFRDNILHKTWISFSLGELYDEDQGRIILDSEFEFSHLSEDKLSATFKMDPAAEEYHDQIRGRLREYGEGEYIEQPQHTVQVRHDITDSPLPGVSFDYDNFQLTCDWRQLYTIFYGEIQLSSKLNGAWVEKQEGFMDGLKEKMARGDLDMMAVITKAMSAFVSGDSENLKIARRLRIKRQMRDAGIPDWNPETDLDLEAESEILQTLKQKRQFCDMQEFSDEEWDNDDEEDEDDDEKSNETQSDDEWEDEDGDDVSVGGNVQYT